MRKNFERATFPSAHPDVLLRGLLKVIWNGVNTVTYCVAATSLLVGFLWLAWTNNFLGQMLELVTELLSITVGQILMGMLFIGFVLLIAVLIDKWFPGFFDQHY